VLFDEQVCSVLFGFHTNKRVRRHAPNASPEKAMHARYRTHASPRLSP
jgi:hypothetical protein